MKKKLVLVLLVMACALCCTVCLVACNPDTCAVTFDANGGVFSGGAETTVSNVVQNTTAKQPAAPVKEGYELLGWAADKDGNEMWNFRAYSVSEDVTLYAVWVKTYTVTLNANGGQIQTGGSSQSSTVTLTVHADTAIGEVEYQLSKSDCLPAGWTTDAEGTDPWNIEFDEVTENMTLYAVWRNKREVRFYAGDDATFDNGENTIKVEVPEGETVKEVPTPVREGYDLIGWKKEYAGVWSDEEPVNSNISVYAVWQLCDDAELSAPALTFKGNTYSWQAVERAIGYSVTVTHQVAGMDKPEVYKEKLTELSWTFPETFPNDEITLTTGDRYTVTVTAYGDGIETLTSAASISFNYKTLEPASGFVFNTTTGELRWDAVANANFYTISIDDGDSFSTDYNYINLKGYSVGTHVVTVTPSSYYDYQRPTPRTTTVNHRILPKPQNLSSGLLYGCTRLTWDEVDGANAYIVNIGEAKFTTDNNYYDFTDDSLFPEGTATVTVQAYNSDGMYLVSDKSSEKNVTFYYSLSVSRNENLSCSYTLEQTNYSGTLYAPNTKQVLFEGYHIYTDTGVDSSNYYSYSTVSPVQPLKYFYGANTDTRVFCGWYTTSNFSGEPYDFSQNLNSNLHLYAKYEAIPFGWGYDNIDFFGKNYTSAEHSYAIGAWNDQAIKHYFSVPTTGNFTLNIENLTGGTKWLTVYNVTQERTYCTELATLKYTFNANAGDMLYFEVYTYNSIGTANVYLEGNAPADGGRVLGYNALDSGEETTVKYTVATFGAELCITAADRDGETFVGWYIGNECVSTDKSYTFTVNKNIELVAKYEKNETAA